MSLNYAKKRLLAACLFLLGFLPLQAQHEGIHYYVDGENLRRAGQFEKAIQEFNKAIQKEPSNYKYIYSKAISEFQTRKVDAALVSINNVIRLREDFVSAYLLAAKIHQTKGELDKAVFNYEQAFKYETDVSKKVGYKFVVMRKYINEKNYKVAYEKIKEAKAIAPDNKEVIFFYAKLSNLLGYHQEAKTGILSLENQIKNLKIEDNAKYYYELGYAHYKLEEFDKANAAWAKADVPPYKEKISKFGAKYLTNIALAYFKFYENETSKSYLDQALKVQKDFAMIHVILAQLSRRNSDHSKTIDHYKTALKGETNPAKKIAIYDKIADLYLEANDYDGSLAAINEALTLRKDDAATIRLKANVLYKMGKFQESVEVIQFLLKQRIDEATRMDLFFLLGLNGKKMGNQQLTREGFGMALKSSLRDAAEVELKALRELNELEEDAQE